LQKNINSVSEWLLENDRIKTITFQIGKESALQCLVYFTGDLVIQLFLCRLCKKACIKACIQLLLDLPATTLKEVINQVQAIVQYSLCTFKSRQ